MRRRFLAIAILATASGAFADPEPEPPVTPKSPTMAVAITTGGWLVPLAFSALSAPGASNTDGPLYFALAGIAIGPALGQLYVEAPGRALPGLLVRTLGLYAFVVGGDSVFRDVFPCGADCTTPKYGLKTATALALGGVMATAGSIVFDTFDVRNGAARWNAHHLQAAPTLVGTSTDQVALGLGLSGDF